ncbi:MAG: hypothetical protein CMD33_01740 [Flavobacteriales bacterium]|jgi:hypothetical protein|nr:hypothetical protein [Flavobacteriales bacterium]
MSEVVEMIRVQFDYMDGKLSLREALDAFEECGSDCTRGQLEKMLRESPRYNVTNIKEPRTEDEV